jgi:hypothetical protein
VERGGDFVENFHTQTQQDAVGGCGQRIMSNLYFEIDD